MKSKHADLTLSIDGRKFINSAGTHNMPSGEIFTSPVEDSVNGWIYFTYPAITGGREVEGIRLEFENGKVVKASAEKNEDYLMKMLDMDEGLPALWVNLRLGPTMGFKNSQSLFCLMRRLVAQFTWQLALASLKLALRMCRQCIGT